MTEFEITEQHQGGTAADYTPETCTTHMAIGFRVEGQTPEEAVARGTATAERISDLIDGETGVHWLTTARESAYSFLANTVNALSQLTEQERAEVLAAAPGLADLRRLTTLWVVRSTRDARLYVVSGPGHVPGHGTAHRATDTDLQELS